MEYRTLPGTDLKLSLITFGTIAFKRDRDAGKKAMRLALDRGVNTVHSSYEYGSRDIIKEVLAERKDRDKLIQIIKMPNPDTKRTDFAYKPGFSESLVDEALRDLGVGHIHLLQYILRDDTECDPVKSVDGLQRYRDSIAADFASMRAKGKVSHMGCFVYNNTFAQAAMTSGLFTFLLGYYNLYDITLRPALEQAAAKNMGFLAFRPFHGGILNTKRADRNALPVDDKFRKPWAFKQLEERDAIFAASAFTTTDLTRAAIKFPISSPNVTSMITGMNTTAQVEELLSAIDGKYLDPTLGRTLHDAAKRVGVLRECNR